MDHSSSTHPARVGSLLWVALCFLLCFLTALGWLLVGPRSASILVDSFVADLLATLVIFIFSRIFKNSSFYDSYWSLAPPFFFGYWWVTSTGEVDQTRAALAALVVGFWSLRLTMNWALHWPGLVHEDWRYAMLRNKAPRFAFFTDLFLIHVFPTGQVFLGMLPLYAVTRLGTEPIGAVDLLAFVVGVGAVLLEMVADIQLHRFLRQREPGQLLDKGLWSYSRHPNYFGEFMFWVSLGLFGLAAAPTEWWWQMLGAIAMLVMFLAASIPMMEERLSARPGHRAITQRVSRFILWPPKRNGPKENA